MVHQNELLDNEITIFENPMYTPNNNDSSFRNNSDEEWLCTCNLMSAFSFSSEDYFSKSEFEDWELENYGAQRDYDCDDDWSATCLVSHDCDHLNALYNNKRISIYSTCSFDDHSLDSETCHQPIVLLSYRGELQERADDEYDDSEDDSLIEDSIRIDKDELQCDTTDSSLPFIPTKDFHCLDATRDDIRPNTPSPRRGTIMDKIRSNFSPISASHTDVNCIVAKKNETTLVDDLLLEHELCQLIHDMYVSVAVHFEDQAPQSETDSTAVSVCSDVGRCVQGIYLMQYLFHRFANSWTWDDILCFMNRVFAPHSQSYRYYQQQRRLYVLVPVPYHPCHVDQFHPDRYYRFMNMEHPRLYNDIINVMMYDNREQNFWQKVHQSCSSMIIVRKVEAVMSRVLSDPFVTKDYVDYVSISISDQFNEMKMVAQLLRELDVSMLGDEEKLSLFINVYNMMVIHALIVRGCADDSFSREVFLQTDFYFIGPYKVCPNDLYHVILRHQSAPDYKYYLEEYRPTTQFDYRIHFILCNGCHSSAIPSAISIETIDQVLDLAAVNYINKHVRFDLDKREIILPSLLRQYRKDLCSGSAPSALASLLSVSRFLNDQKWRDMWSMLSISHITKENIISYLEPYISKEQLQEDLPCITYNTEWVYLEYNWRSNRKSINDCSTQNMDSDESIEHETSSAILFEEVMSSPDLRHIFALFCQHEWSAENLKFYEVVLEYKESEPSKRCELVPRIYNQFLARGAESEINVSRSLVRPIEHSMNSTTGDSAAGYPDELFDRLQREVSLVLTDSYSRFHTSEFYQAMKRLQREKETQKIISGFAVYAHKPL